MFSHDMKENASGFVDINVMDMKTLRLMLMYMYTNTLKRSRWDKCPKLFMAADKYELPSLKGQCSSYILKHITVENACEMLTLADLFEDLDFKSSVQEYIVHHDEELFMTAGWKNIIQIILCWQQKQCI
ncbi:TD and POZ domain-containing protein 2 [Caerostris extrusa]|uniref:TD and POZ domain-containing protein 2 n=1 Tax=Caerostris extrusa TaxID=172846 RepID=A0AAV4NMS3_CAEEX|nr:TD and POZ domain-containing protein 2 [Caerostris extrusa]